MLIHLQMVSDGRIVRRVLGGRRDDFGLLVRRYYGAVHSVARALDWSLSAMHFALAQVSVKV
ncbi:MAG TPA: hypothetical protein VMZ06_03935 [Candidatus Bathyarchaeia archaeon]|nr:hypothetical protein [Candidatus Bathyarchaeia archaeon]